MGLYGNKPDTVFIDNVDYSRTTSNQPQILVVTSGGSTTISKEILKFLATAQYVGVEQKPEPDKNNIVTTKHNRQREWWNTPKSERKRKK